MTDKIDYTFQGKGFPLIKIKSRDIIEKLQHGSFYMNSLKAYRNMYKNRNDIIVGDPNEGKLIFHNANTRISKLEANEVADEVHEQTVRDHLFSTANEDDFVFCMFGVNPNKHSSFNFTEEQKQKLNGFDDTALLITDVGEFCRRILKSAIAKGLEITSGFVNYYDPKKDDVSRLLSLVKYGMQSIVFHKVSDYSYQQEYRFTIPNNSGAEYLELDIGNITDISKIFSTEEILNSSMVKTIVE